MRTEDIERWVTIGSTVVGLGLSVWLVWRMLPVTARDRVVEPFRRPVRDLRAMRARHFARNELRFEVLMATDALDRYSAGRGRLPDLLEAGAS